MKRSAEGQTWLFEVEMTQRRVAVQDRPAVVRSPGRSCRRLSWGAPWEGRRFSAECIIVAAHAEAQSAPPPSLGRRGVLARANGSGRAEGEERGGFATRECSGGLSICLSGIPPAVSSH